MGDAGMVVASSGMGGTEGGAGGTGGAKAFPERPLCGGSADPTNAAWCEGVESVALIRGALADASGDGRVSPGEEASVRIGIRNDGTVSVNYPCVGLLADDPAVTIIGGEAHQNPEWDFFAIPPGEMLELVMSFSFGASMLPGTTVRFVAWLDVLNSGCTNGNEIEFDIPIE
jgi:hypothetical protein